MNKTYIKTALLLFIDLLFSMFLIDNVKQVYYLDLKVSIANTGLLITAYTVSKFLFEIPTGFVSDKYGRKISVIIGILIIEGSLLFLLINNFVFLFISSVLLGLGRTFISGSFDSMIYEKISSFDDKKIKIVQNIKRFLWYGGYGVGILFSGIIYDKYHGRIVIILTILIQFLALIVLFIVKNEDYIADEKITFLNNVRKTFKNKYLIGVILSFIFFTVIDIPFDFYVIVFLNRNGMSVTTASLIVGLSVFVSPLTGLLSIKFNKRVDIFNVRFGSIAPTFCLLLIGLTQNLYLIVVLLFLKAFLFSMISPSRYLIANKMIDNSYRATAHSIKAFLMALFSSISVSVFAFLSDIFNMEKAIVILAVISILLLLINGFIILKGISRKISIT